MDTIEEDIEIMSYKNTKIMINNIIPEHQLEENDGNEVDTLPGHDKSIDTTETITSSRISNGLQTIPPH